MIEINLPSGKYKKYKNLQGILSRIARYKVDVVRIREKNFKGILEIIWGDGSFCSVDFESYKILKMWITRHPILIGLEFKVQDGPIQLLALNDERIR